MIFFLQTSDIEPSESNNQHRLKMRSCYLKVLDTVNKKEQGGFIRRFVINFGYKSPAHKMCDYIFGIGTH